MIDDYCQSSKFQEKLDRLNPDFYDTEKGDEWVDRFSTFLEGGKVEVKEPYKQLSVEKSDVEHDL